MLCAVLCWASPAYATVYGDAVLATPGLRSYWRLDEASGTRAVDSRPGTTPNHATYAGAFTLGRPGALTGDADTAVLLNGSSGYLHASDAGSEVGDVFSLEAWVKRTSTGARTDGIFAKGTGSFALSFVNDRLVLRKNGTGDVVASTDRAISQPFLIRDTAYHHIVATKSGATSKLYVDGVDRTGTITNRTMDNSSTTPLTIGRVGTSNYLAATVDEAALYTVALTAAQVQDHFAKGRGTSPVAPAPPSASPPAGGYPGPQSVTLSSTPGATIRYTTDGTLPSRTSGLIYTAPITVDRSLTIRAVAYDLTATSAVVLHAYTIATASPPAPPANVGATAGDSSVALSWTASTGATSYQVWRGTGSGTGVVLSQLVDAAPTGTSFIDNSAVNGTTYTYAVRAVNSAGVSGNSNTATATPAAAPTTGASFVGDFETAITSTDWGILTELGAANPALIGGTVRRGSGAVSMTVEPGQKRSELQPKTNGTTLKVMPGTTAWFADSIYLAPGFPTFAGASNNFQVLMQWKDAGGTVSSSPPVSLSVQDGQIYVGGGVGCPGGAKEWRNVLAPATTGVWTDFEFQIHFDRAGAGWIDAYVNGNQVGSRFYPPCGTIYPSPYAEFTNLRLGYYRNTAITTPGTVIHDEYRMGPTLASVSLAGLGAGTTTSPPPVATAPGAPTIGTPTPGDGSVTVGWSAPAADGGAAISGYRVRTFAGTTQVGPTAEVLDGAATSTVITGLTNGTQYTFDVAAVNSVAQGPFSNPSAPVTPAAPNPTPTPTTRTVTLTPAADAMARQASPTSNFGGATPLGSDSEDVAGNASTRVTSYLKFTIPSLAAGESIADATLSLFVTDPTTNGPKVFPTAATWSESGLTWNAAPSRSGTTPVGDFGAMSTLNARSSTTVTGVTAAGDVSFELFADGTDGLDFASREDATPANRPELVLTIRSG